jgi:hypothetical protein
MPMDDNSAFLFGSEEQRFGLFMYTICGHTKARTLAGSTAPRVNMTRIVEFTRYTEAIEQRRYDIVLYRETQEEW